MVGVLELEGVLAGAVHATFAILQGSLDSSVFKFVYNCWGMK